MKKVFSAVLIGLALSAQAQKNTLLEQAFWQTKPDVSQVKAQIEQGNSPSQLNANSFDPVVLAINAEAPTETILYLLNQPGNTITKLTHDGRTYVHWAAYRGNIAVMEALFAKGAKAVGEDSHGATPLNFAASTGQQNTQVFDLCLSHGADVKKDLNHDGANALLLAVTNDKDLKLTDYFVSKGLSLKSTDAAGNNAFSYAARSGNVATLKALQERGVPVNPTAMVMAAQGSRRGPAPIEVYQYLESVGVKPTVTNKNGENVLHSLVRRPKQNETIQYFLEKGVDVNQADEEGNTPFMNAAASNRDLSVLELLLPKVKNINQSNQKGATALALAVKGNSTDAVNLLLSKGADVHMTDKAGDNLAAYLVQSYNAGGGMGGPGGMPPMGNAGGPRPEGGNAPRPEGGPRPEGMNGPRTSDFDTKMKLLQDKGLDLTAPEKNGNTLYHLAVAKNDLSLVKKLEPLHIDINARNAEGITALHKAAMVSKDDAMMKYLISIGAKKDIPTNFKETAYDLASENETLAKNNVSLNFLK